MTEEYGVARVDIDLPDTVLEVEVVDESGEPVTRASIALMPYPVVEPPAQGWTDEDGIYSVRGLNYSEYRLEAHHGGPAGRLRSDPAAVSISKKAPSASVRLILRKTLVLRGRVVSDVGSGVPGAQINVSLPAVGGLRGMLIPQVQTSHDGSFEVEVPQGADRLEAEILAPGFVLATVDLAADLNRERIIRLTQTGGGTLVVSLGEPSKHLFGKVPFVDVEHDGRRHYDTATLRTWARMNGEPTGLGSKLLRVPLMPAGRYRSCWVPTSEEARKEVCEQGFLSPQGTLELVQRDSERREKE